MHVLQKDGSLNEFDENKIVKSLIEEITMFTSDAVRIANRVKRKLELAKLDTVTGPLIREAVCMALLQDGYEYARYRYTRVGMPLYDAQMFDTGYGTGDNANLHLSPETIHKRKADRLAKEQALLSMPRHISDMHQSGDIHIHDLEYFTTRPFCKDHDLRFFFYYGLVCDGTGDHTSIAGPAMRPEVAVMHAAKVLGASQTNCSGGQGFYNFLCFLAPYFKGAPYDTYLQCMQMFIYEMTQMLVARGGQVVFSSIQLSPGIPELWRDKFVVSHGKIWDGKDGKNVYTYGYFEYENRMLFKALMEVMLAGDASGKPFYFPKPEINIAPEFIDDSVYDQEPAVFDKDSLFRLDMPSYKTLYGLAFELAAKYGTPYFDNTVPKYRQKGGVDCYQCCAYSFNSNSDTDKDFDKKLNFVDGNHFSMGSWQVVTLNLPRLAYNSKSEDEFVDNVERLIRLTVDVFSYKRQCLDRIIQNGVLGFLQQRIMKNGKLSPPLCDFDALVYTIGIIGLNEVVQMLSGTGIDTNEGSKMAIRLCLKMKNACESISKKSGLQIAFARTPAETTGQRFAYLDLKKRYPVVCQGNKEEALKLISKGKNDVPIYYTNGTHVPPGSNIPIGERIRIEQAFFPILDGGNITHIWLGEQAPSPDGLRDMALNLCTRTNCGYFSFTRDFTTRTRFYKMYTPNSN